MLFYILMGGFFAPVIATIITVALSAKCSRAEHGTFMFLFSSMLSAFPVAGFFIIWQSHASDLGTIEAQNHVISVYEERRDDLTAALSGFDYPSPALLNADSPVKAIADQLSSIESDLAEARAKKAEAIVSIERRRNGPVSGVISFVGDYK